MSGYFITLEGGEGSGKSSQIRRIKSFLSRHYPDKEVVISREPGGTPEAEKISASGPASGSASDS